MIGAAPAAICAFRSSAFSRSSSALGERVRDPLENDLAIGRLLQEVERTALERLDRGLDAAVAADHDDHDVWILGTQPVQNVETVHGRHLDVEEDEVGGLFGIGRQRGRPVLGVPHLIPLVLQHLAERLADPGLVVDDEDARGVLLHVPVSHFS